jgi:hypothetical protein
MLLEAMVGKMFAGPSGRPRQIFAPGGTLEPACLKNPPKLLCARLAWGP